MKKIYTAPRVLVVGLSANTIIALSPQDNSQTQLKEGYATNGGAALVNEQSNVWDEEW